VPALVRWPGLVQPHTEINQIFSAEDWVQTLMAAAGECNQNEVLVVGYCGPRRSPVTIINERTVTCPRFAATSPLMMVCAKVAS